MPQTSAWRAPENIFSSSNTLVPPPQPLAMAPARAAALSICITTGACSLLAPEPKSLLTSSGPMASGFTCTSGLRLSPSLFLLGNFGFSLFLLLDFGFVPPPLPSAHSCLHPFSAKSLRRQPNMRMKLVAVAYVHIYVSASPVNHSCVTAFLPTLVTIWMIVPLNCRLHWACRNHPRLKESKLMGKLRAEKQGNCQNV